MPKQVGKSGLAAKLGDKLRKAIEMSRSKPIEQVDTGLPAGIQGGVAKLADCKFTTIKEGKQNAGQCMFYAAGIVVEPKEYNGVETEGLRTQISELLFDTPKRSRKTLQEHVNWVMDQLATLHPNPEEIKSEMTEDNLEEIATNLKEAQPYFRFRTWKGDKQETGPFAGREPQTQSVWGGYTEYNGEISEGVQDETSDASEEIESEPEPAEETDTSDDAPVNFTELATAADTGDGDAAAKMQAEALAAGVIQAEIDDAKNWAVVAELVDAILAGGEESSVGEGEGTEAEPEETLTLPKLKDVWNYRPLDQKTKKPVKKPIQCEDVALNTKLKTADLKNLVNTKIIYKGVQWDSLESLE